jgi:hypothetical protein
MHRFRTKLEMIFYGINEITVNYTNQYFSTCAQREPISPSPLLNPAEVFFQPDLSVPYLKSSESYASEFVPC